MAALYGTLLRPVNTICIQDVVPLICALKNIRTSFCVRHSVKLIGYLLQNGGRFPKFDVPKLIQNVFCSIWKK